MSGRVSISDLQDVKALPFLPPRLACSHWIWIVCIPPLPLACEGRYSTSGFRLWEPVWFMFTFKIHMEGSFNDRFRIVSAKKHHQTEQKAEPGPLICFNVKKTLAELFLLRFNSDCLKFVQILLDQQVQIQVQMRWKYSPFVCTTLGLALLVAKSKVFRFTFVLAQQLAFLIFHL